MPPHSSLYIDGHWSEGVRRQTSHVSCPASGEVIATFSDASREDADLAIAAARRAYDSTAWRQSPRQRSAFLLSLASELESNAESIADEIASCNGKLIGEARHEITVAASEFRYYAGLARNIFGRVTEVEPGLMAMLSREPMGVAGIIVPWNAPITLLARSLAPALAAGCSVIVKAASQTALPTATVIGLAEKITGLPRGIINLIQESGQECGQRLVQSEDVDVISYTGSTPVGKAIMAAGASTLKRLNLELGGNAPVLVLPCADLKAAAAGITKGALAHAGQVCVAASRVVVHRDVAESLRAALISSLSEIKVGLQRDQSARMGPLINSRSRERVLDLQDDAGSGSIRHLACKTPAHLPNSGGFITPGLVEIKDPSSKLLHEEVFGPLLSMIVCGDEQEMIDAANRSRFGLAAAVWTNDLGKAQRMAKALKSGTVWINGHMRLHAEIETGGYKESGIGRLHGVEGLEAFLQTKHVSWVM